MAQSKYIYAQYTAGARGGRYPECACCGGAIASARVRADSRRYFAAKLERWCFCEAPQYPVIVGRQMRDAAGEWSPS